VVQAIGNEVGGIVFVVLFALTQAAALAVVARLLRLFPLHGTHARMRALDIQVVGGQNGRTPSPARAAGRGVLSVVFFLATYTAYTFVLGHYDTPLSTFHQVSRAACIFLASLAFFGHLWQVWTETAARSGTGSPGSR
jgi:hypothetical protein